MCEFKVVKQNDGTQIMEDIVIIGYSDNNGLIFKDILGAGELLESALILDVNTINQTLLVLEHPLIRDFIGLLKDLTDKKAEKEQIDAIIGKLNELKNTL